MFLRVRQSFGAARKIFHKKECSALSGRCLVGSDLLSAELCSDQRFQHYGWFHQHKLLHKCRYLQKVCMKDGNYDLSKEQVILLSLLTISQPHHIPHQ